MTQHSGTTGTESHDSDSCLAALGTNPGHLFRRQLSLGFSDQPFQVWFDLLEGHLVVFGV